MAIMLGALDIGTSMTRLYAGQVVENKCEVIACVSMQTRGVNKGVIRNIEEVAKMIGDLQQKMSSEYNIDLYDVEVNFSTMDTKATPRRGHKVIPTGYEITETDQAEAEDNATVQEAPNAPEINFQHFRQKYEVDGRAVVSPLGMTGTNLVANILELSAPRTSYEAVKAVLHRAGMKSQEIFHSGVAVLEAVLDAKAREDGAIVIDFGAGVVDYAVACHGVIATVGTLAVGGKHLTRDLAHAFKLSQQKAEEVKLAMGSAMLQSDRAKERYEIKDNLLARGNTRSISVHAIQTVTTERIDETLRLIYDMLIAQDVLNHIHGGVYLTGGTASIPGIVERASQIFALPCRIGIPLDIEMTDDILREPHLHATGMGLLKCRKERLGTVVHKPSFFANLFKFFKN
jgi:cell division protein FtsA